MKKLIKRSLVFRILLPILTTILGGGTYLLLSYIFNSKNDVFYGGLCATIYWLTIDFVEQKCKEC